jgi:hypothetical protein
MPPHTHSMTSIAATKALRTVPAIAAGPRRPVPCARAAGTDTKLRYMRRFLSLRWLGLHAAMVVIVAGFLALGWWQLTRAEGGNALSWGYTFEWPLFAGFVVVFWIKVMRDELHEAQAREDAPAPPVTAGPLDGDAPAGAPDGGPSGAGGAADEDEELAAYNAYLSRLNAEAGRTGARLAGRASRRQAVVWAARKAQPPAAGNPPHMEV